MHLASILASPHLMTIMPSSTNRSYSHWYLPLAVLAVLLIAIRPMVAAEPAEAPRPNILVIVADDLGWNDVGYHNVDMRTPHLDELARAGVELDWHYVQPECTPTRVSLLTGRYPSRFGASAMGASNDQSVPLETLTLPSMLKSLGYATGMAGKWHLGSKPEWGPNQYGFDSSYGSLAGAVGMYDHHYRLNSPFAETWHRDGQLIPGAENGRHSTDLLAEEAERWIRSHAESGQPWFFYLPFHAVHTPLVERDPQWQAMNEHHASPDRRLYAAAVSHMDAAIGQVVASLNDTAQAERTLILFTSDNGAQVNHAGNAYPPPDPALKDFSSNEPLRGRKTEVYEGGVRVPAAIVWPQSLKPGKLSAPMHAVDWLPTFSALLQTPPAEDAQWDGQNNWPLIAGEVDSPSERTFYLVWRANRGSEAVRRGDWKLLRRRGKPWELYNLKNDPYETTDLASQEPQQVTDLTALYRDQRSRDAEAVRGN
jgi:arylsulfatase A-like enzyme